MSLMIASLNSGSNGNCYYVGNETEAIFVDAGLSCRETERRMKGLGLEMGLVRAIFISHEHADHITGMAGIAKKWKIPVYITPATHHKCSFALPPEWMLPFQPHIPIQVGGLHVHPFPKHHDGCDPHSFTISGNGVSIGVYTDIGKPCDHLIEHFRRCNAVFLEANYDEVMLDTGRYPIHLKNRIRNGRGHLSNRQALDLFIKHRSVFLSHVLLSHLSKENNDPELVRSLFQEHAGSTEVTIASRYNASKVITVHAHAGHESPSLFLAKPRKEQQMALF